MQNLKASPLDSARKITLYIPTAQYRRVKLHSTVISLK